MFLSSFAEGMGFAVFLPVLQLSGVNLLDQGSPHRYAVLAMTLLSRLGLPTRLPLATVLTLLALIVVIRTAFLNLENVQVAETVYQFVTTMDLRVYQSILRADWTTIIRHRSNDFMNLLTTEHERLAAATYEFLLLLAGLLNACLYFGLALLISVRLTLLFTGCGLLLAVALRNKTERVHDAATKASTELMRLSAEALEHLQNLKAVKAYATQSRDIATFSDSIQSASDALIDTQRRAAATNLSWQGGALLAMIVILYFALTLHSSSPAVALLLLAVFARMVPRLSAVSASAQLVVSNLPAHTKMQSVISELSSAVEHIPLRNSQIFLQRTLVFENVVFRFHPDQRRILDEISLTIPARKMTALIGPSGAGKSTLADLAMGLLSPDSGRILLDEIELAPPSVHSWRASTGYVAQDTVLFNDTVRANLLWANPDATDAEMREALTMTDADFVLDLPDGLETAVGERGMRFSQGERQRLALARAMLRNPSMLILDEATNHLDSESEHRVMESVAKLRDRLTILLIAHRMSALRFVDLIYVLEDGRIVEHGGWDSLMHRANGRFRRLYELQEAAYRGSQEA